ELGHDEYIYVVNYFGQISDGNIKEIKSKYQNIIVDNTQAFFQKPVEGIDTLYSCRKFFGVPDGAYLYTNSVLQTNLETDQSQERMKHILGRYEESANLYYNEFKKNDELLKNTPLKVMSKITHNILCAIDYKNIKKRRLENYLYLDKELSGINKLALKTP